MKIHCIRHEPFEGLASIDNWITVNQIHTTFTLTYLDQQFPDELNFDLLIIMGGTASVYDEAKHDWLADEKEFIRKVLDKGKKILGICLGAQLLADVLGAKVYPGADKEIGWHQIEFGARAKKEYSFLPITEEVFHWHGDTFDLPPDSIPIASSVLTKNQGFIYKERVWGIQFHLEMTEQSIINILKGAGKELVDPGPYIQSKEHILENTSHLAANNKLMFSILDYLKNHSS